MQHFSKQDLDDSPSEETAEDTPKDKIFTQRVYVCPNCGKHRMIRPKGHVVPHETREVETPSGKMVEIPIDVCDTCQRRIVRKYFQPTKQDVKKVIKAVKEQKDLGDKSLEDIL